MSLLFAVPPAATIPVAGQDVRCGIGRIFCVGRNYAEHVREMGGDPARGTPIFFDKSPSCLVEDGARIAYPPATLDLHHEIELGVVLSEGGRDVSEADAARLIAGYTVALDMTRRDLQAAAKKGGKPWDMAKSFDHAAPCSMLIPMPGVALEQGAITLDVNGERRQTGDLAQMIWSVSETIASLSKLLALMPGDMLLTGTPSGVGPVAPGDSLHGAIEGVGTLSVSYAEAV
ncbi:MAG: fumarylacetoacetate hydrolase family protein [Pseudomonadota bacterium]